MNWNLIMSETEDRVPLNTLVWRGVRLKLEKISEKEKISLSRIVRHSLNNFLKEYEKEEELNTTK